MKSGSRKNRSDCFAASLRRFRQAQHGATQASRLPCRLQCLPQLLICDHEWIVRRRTLMRKAVADRDVASLGLIRAKQVIPNEQNSAIVLIDVLRVARMMYPVCRGRIDHPLEPADAWYQLGVNKELVG